MVWLEKSCRRISFIFICGCMWLAYWSSDKSWAFYQMNSVNDTKYQILQTPSTNISFTSQRPYISFKNQPLKTDSPRTEATKRTKNKPSIRVTFVGVKKCGTGALKTFMSVHPRITMAHNGPICKKPLASQKKFSASSKANYQKTNNAIISFDNHCFHNIEAFERSEKPSKVIILLCDPVLRAYSDFKHIYRVTKAFAQKTTFESAVDKAISAIEKAAKEPENFRSYIGNLRYTGHIDYTVVSLGIYHEFIREYYKMYGHKDVLLLSGETLKTDPASVLAKVESFLEIPHVIEPDWFFVSNKTGYHCIRPASKSPQCLDHKHKPSFNGIVPPPDEKTLEKLRIFYKPHNKKLFQLANTSFNWTQ